MVRRLGLFALTCGLWLAPTRSEATVLRTFAGTVPVTLREVRFEAALTISGDTLTIVLSNDSTSLAPPSPTRNPADLLTSFYFDVFDGVSRPTLVYTGASGDVCLTDRNAPDDCSVVDAENDLRAFAAGDGTWQLKSGLTLQPGSDVLSFGIGTAGNNSLTPNGFNGNVVGGFDYGIYAGDVTTQNLHARYLVKELATFTFSGVSGFSEADISSEALFGLGTRPDSTGFVPEPSSAALLALGLLLLAARRKS